MHWTYRPGHTLRNISRFKSAHLEKIEINARSMCAVYTKYAIFNPQEERTLEILYFPFIKIAEISSGTHHLAIDAVSPEEAVQKYFYQLNKTAEQTDRKIEKKLQLF
jgi:hypothetical protein